MVGLEGVGDHAEYLQGGNHQEHLGLLAESLGLLGLLAESLLALRPSAGLGTAAWA